LTPMEWELPNSLRADCDLQKSLLPRRQEAFEPWKSSMIVSTTASVMFQGKMDSGTFSTADFVSAITGRGIGHG